MRNRLEELYKLESQYLCASYPTTDAGEDCYGSELVEIQEEIRELEAKKKQRRKDDCG